MGNEVRYEHFLLRKLRQKILFLQKLSTKKIPDQSTKRGLTASSSPPGFRRAALMKCVSKASKRILVEFST